MDDGLAKTLHPRFEERRQRKIGKKSASGPAYGLGLFPRCMKMPLSLLKVI
jgi:hypothetical protein